MESHRLSIQKQRKNLHGEQIFRITDDTQTQKNGERSKYQTGGPNQEGHQFL